MVNQKVELRRVRDFGENINDTFQFIRQEFKTLVLTFLSIAGIFIVAEAIGLGLFEEKFVSLTRSASVNGTQLSPDQTLGLLFSANYFFLLVNGFLAMEVMYATVASYMKAYLQFGSHPPFKEVWIIFRKTILRVIFYSILAWIMIIGGFCLCGIPGIYLMVVLAPFEIIIIVEDCSLGDAVSRCFALIKDNFWLSFGIYIVAYLISYLGGGLIGFFAALISGVISYLSTKDINNVVGFVMSSLFIVVYFFLIILFVSMSLNYFSLVEKRDGTGILERVQSIGSNTDINPNTEEEY